MKIPKSRSTLSRLTLLYTAISLFTITCLYIILSDRFLLYLFRNDSSCRLLYEIQSYKDIAFVLLTAVILFVVSIKRDAITNNYINSNKLKYRNLFNSFSNGAVYTDTDGLVLKVNKAYLDILDVTKEQIIGKAIYSKMGKLVHEDSIPLESDEHPAKIAIETKKPVLNKTIGVLNPTTNKYAWLKVNSIPEFKAGNLKPYRVLITVNDITLLKDAQDELQNTQKETKESLKKVALSEFLLKEANVMAKIGVYEINSEKNSMHFSDEMYHIFNIPLGQEYLFEATRKAFKKQSETLLIKVVKECMEKGAPFDEELEIEFAEKGTKWVRLIGKPIYDENNKIIGRRGIMQDVTDLKVDEEALKQSKKELEKSLAIVKRSEFLLRQAEKLAEMGAYELLTEENTLYLSNELYAIFGLKEKYIPSLEQIYNLFSDASRSKMRVATKNLVTKGIPYDLELYSTNFKNEYMWVRIITEPIFNKNKKVIGRRGVLQDITDTKRSQLELERSKNKLQNSLGLVEEREYSLKEAGRMAKIGYWRYSNKTDTIIWSDAVHQIYGTDSKEGVPELDVILSVFNEESKQKLVEGTLNLANKGVSFDIELQLINLNNEKRWMRNIGEAIFNDENEIVGRRGVSQDITEQKLTSSKIEEAEKMYRLLADNVNDLICLQEPDSTFIYISPSIKTLLGYEPSEFLGKEIFGIVHKDDVQSLKEAMKEKVFTRMVKDAFTFRIRHKEGRFIWLEFLTSPVYKDKVISYFITSARDVTQRMLAKQEIQEYQTSLQKMTIEVTLIEEKQKKEIASNIHDHLSQSLIISKMRINELKKKPQLKLIDKDLKFIETHISEALENSRKITYELSPPVLYQFGVVAALNWLLDNVETTHKIECRFNSNITEIKLDDVKLILLYRSIQEVITNAIKYANASLITLNIDENKLGVYILITDNGDGFDTSLLNNYNNHSGSGFGLFTVQERIRNIQGKFTIESEVNQGTAVKISLN